jgi:large subunit ribosomal protein L21
MYAVIATGGKQYRVAPDDRLTVERLAGEVGAMIALERVLMIGEEGQVPVVGTPVLPKAAVFAEILAQERGETAPQAFAFFLGHQAISRSWWMTSLARCRYARDPAQVKS